MIFSVLVVAFLMIGAVSLAIIDKALSPNQGRYPCAHPVLHWLLRLYALAIFNGAAVMMVTLWSPSPVVVTPELFLGSMAMAATHVFLLGLLLQHRLPTGTWGRIQAVAENAKRRSQAAG